MKKAGIVVIALLCIGLVCGGFYYLSQRNQRSTEDGTQLTEIQKIITKDLESKYPATPREVIKLYNRILDCYYDEKVTDEELDQLADQALLLFDTNLQANNPKKDYLESIKADIANYEERSKKIAQFEVCDSNDVVYKTDNEDEIAYVAASYFVREGNSYTKTYQTYVLRKDSEDQWKILTFYQTDGGSTEED